MLLFLLSVLFVVASAADLPADIARDAKLSTPELLTTYGYPVETYTVQTEDGYILTLHRIPHGKDSTTIGEPFFLQHGLFCTSSDWIITLPERALGYLLADAGYDVWMGNFRGNTYSKEHVRYSSSDKEFWDFSWNENGLYDLPAMIDYVLKATNKEKLYYAGHSMGTTSFYVLMSQKPEYNDKIRVMFSLAPIAFMNHVTSPLLKSVAWSYSFDETLWNAIGLYEFFPSNTIMQAAGQNACNDDSSVQAVCSNILFLLVGYDTSNLNTTQLPVILSHTPAGASGKQMLQYAQEVVSAHFRKWDYGLISNVINYGTTAPPDYDLSKITAPVVLYLADNDWVSNTVDVKRLNASLANAVDVIHVDWPKWNHMDYLWGINAKELIYDKLIEMLPKY